MKKRNTEVLNKLMFFFFVLLSLRSQRPSQHCIFIFVSSESESFSTCVSSHFRRCCKQHENCSISFKPSARYRIDTSGKNAASIWIPSFLNCHDFDRLRVEVVWLDVERLLIFSWMIFLTSFISGDEHRNYRYPPTEIDEIHFENIFCANSARGKIIAEGNSCLFQAVMCMNPCEWHRMFSSLASCIRILHPQLILLTYWTKWNLSPFA